MGQHHHKEKNMILMWLEYAAFLPSAKLVEMLSVKHAYAAAKIVAGLFYFFDFKHRKRTIRHLLHSGMCSTEQEAEVLAKKCFEHMLKVFVEILKYPQLVNDDNWKQYVTIVPELQKYEAPEESKQVILATGHIGNWELAGNIFCYNFDQTLCSIMRPLANTKIGNYFYRHRVGTHHYTVSKEKGIRPLLAALNKKESIAIVADQHASSSEGVEVTFFGHPARTHMTPALLHLKTRVPIAPWAVIRADDDFHFKIVGGEKIMYEPTGDKEADIRAVTQLFTNELEKLIRKYPDQWIWPHRRWLDCGRKHNMNGVKQ